VATIEMNEFDLMLDQKTANGWVQQFAVRLELRPVSRWESIVPTT